MRRARLAARATGDDAQRHIAAMLGLVARAHDGDRAVTDYRPDGKLRATAWRDDPLNAVDDDTLRRLALECDQRPDGDAIDTALLHWRAGGFERSIGAVDERADELHRWCAWFSGAADCRLLRPRSLHGRAELRIAAAGLGGAVAVHCFVDVAAQVEALLHSWNWRTARVEAAAHTQLLAL